MKRDYKIEYDFDLIQGIGFCIGCANTQPKKKYHIAQWNFIIIFLCFGFSLNFSYKYFHKGMPKTDKNK